MPSVGDTIRDLRRARGWTQARLAEELNRVTGRPTVTADEVKRWERGRRSPITETRRELAEALGVPLATLDEALPDPLRRAHRWLVEDPPQVVETRAGRNVGEHLAEQVEARVVELRHLDDHVGGEDLAPAVERELRATTRLLSDASYTEATGRRLLTAAAELAQLAGWTASDASRFNEAHRLYLGGVDDAHAAGDNALAANLLSSLSYQIANVGRPDDALLLARTAVKGANGAAPAVRALLLERVAWSAAKSGDADVAARALDEVDDAFESRTDGDGEPEWVYWLDRGEVDTMAARIAVELGRPAEAARLLVPVLESYDATHSRESALYWAFLAEAYVRSGELDAAGNALDRARGFAALVRSPRADDRVQRVQALISAAR